MRGSARPTPTGVPPSSGAPPEAVHYRASWQGDLSSPVHPLDQGAGDQQRHVLSGPPASERNRSDTSRRLVLAHKRRSQSSAYDRMQVPVTA